MDENGLCDFCRHGITSFDAAYCYGAYDGTLRRLIHLFKYDRVQTLAGPLGRYLVQALPRDQRFDCVAPIPLHWWKRFQRGFNQCELLAREISRRTGLPVVSALKRVKATGVQAGLTHQQRRLNVRGVFAPRKAVKGRHVLLIDDVLTTGATANAAARALRAAGADRVSFLAIARVDRRPSLPDFVPATTKRKAVAGAQG